MDTCPNCRYAGRPRPEPAWLLWLACLVWLVPLGFLLAGLWPFFILPSIAITVAAVLSVRRKCPQCGKRWRPSSSGASLG
jgi:hypothetical protein